MMMMMTLMKLRINETLYLNPARVAQPVSKAGPHFPYIFPASEPPCCWLRPLFVIFSDIREGDPFLNMEICLCCMASYDNVCNQLCSSSLTPPLFILHLRN